MRLLPLFFALLGWSAAAFAGTPISLNRASKADLAAIEGVGDAAAGQVIALRETRGGLGSVEALRVLNLPEATLDALRANTFVEAAVRKDPARAYANASEVLAEFAAEPDVRAVQAMAMDYAKANPERVAGWLNTARTAFLLPRLDLKYQKNFDYSEDFRYEPDDAGELTRTPYSEDGSNDDLYEVKLQWRLDKLVMSSELIRVINEAQDIVKLRDKVLDEVTRLYFDRRRLQVDLLLNPPADLKGQIESELRLLELTAGIDALTGGSFSAGLPAARK